MTLYLKVWDLKSHFWCKKKGQNYHLAGHTSIPSSHLMTCMHPLLMSVMRFALLGDFIIQALVFSPEFLLGMHKFKSLNLLEVPLLLMLCLWNANVWKALWGSGVVKEFFFPLINLEIPSKNRPIHPKRTYSHYPTWNHHFSKVKFAFVT